MKSTIAQILLILAITSAQCGVIIIIEDDSKENNVITAPSQSKQVPYNNWDYFNEVNNVDDIPDPKDVALMARFIVHNSNWTSIAYTSHAPDSDGKSLAAMFSVSDGPVSKGTGVPYFYVSRLQSAVTDLMDFDNHCSLMMSLAETDICKSKGWDPEDPRCAHVVMTGTFHKMTNKSREYPQAVKAIFSRHPDFINLPANHHFFIAKFNIDEISIQDTFGGPSKVPLADYFNANSEPLNLMPSEFYAQYSIFDF